MTKQPETISVTINRKRVLLEAHEHQVRAWSADLPGGGWIRIERGGNWEPKWSAIINAKGRSADHELRGHSELSAQGAVDDIKKQVRAAAKLFGVVP